MGIPSGWELVLVLLVIVVVFGSKKLPDSARSLGRSLRIFKAETRGLKDDDKEAARAELPPVQEPYVPTTHHVPPSMNGSTAPEPVIARPAGTPSVSTDFDPQR